MDPVDEWELKRNQLLTELQGNHNPFVTHYKKIPIETSNGQSETSPDAQDDGYPVSGDNTLIDQLYQLIYGNRDQLPYFVVSIATMLYLVYLRYRRKTKPEKTKKE